MSLRRRLTISYVSFFAAALLALDVGLYLMVRQSLFNSIDTDLKRATQLVQQDFTNSNQPPPAYFNGNQLVVLLQRPQIPDFEATNMRVQVYQPNGETLAATLGLPSDISLDQESLALALQGRTALTTVERNRVRTRELLSPLIFHDPLLNQDHVGAILRVARSLNETDRALNLLFYVLLVGGLVVLLVAARGGDWLTRAALQPIDEVTRTAQSIVRAEDLSRRVPIPSAQDELQRLTVTVNDLLARLEALFHAQRRFVADVSHELRTPLTAMQGNLEILERGAARDPQLLAESLTDMRHEVARLIRMVNDLLFLVRSEAGIELRHEPVELDTLLLEVHRELRPLADGVTLRIGDEDQIVIPGDRDRIKQALLNLGINALQHTSPGGTVTLGLIRLGDDAVLRVTDTGSGITDDDLPHIFDRFYRSDQARSRHSGGAGLGLAIVRWIAEAHGGYVTVTSQVDQGSCFALHLPLEQRVEVSKLIPSATENILQERLPTITATPR